jgi:hypothetical protein
MLIRCSGNLLHNKPWKACAPFSARKYFDAELDLEVGTTLSEASILCRDCQMKFEVSKTDTQVAPMYIRLDTHLGLNWHQGRMMGKLDIADAKIFPVALKNDIQGDKG